MQRSDLIPSFDFAKDAQKFFSISRSYPEIVIVPPTKWRADLYTSHSILITMTEKGTPEINLKWFAWANQCAGLIMDLTQHFIDTRVAISVPQQVKPYFLFLMPENAFENIFYPFYSTTGGILGFTQQNWVMILLELFATRPQVAVGPSAYRDKTPDEWRSQGVVYRPK